MWDQLQSELHIVLPEGGVIVAPPTDQTLNELESALQVSLPVSYREFMKRFGAGELAEEMVEIDDIVRAEVTDRQRGGARIDYQRGQWEQAPIVLGDRLALRRVVANLADNALKYGGSAHLRSTIAGNNILLTIDDEGPGIPLEQRQAMLDPFSRLETSRNRGTGGAGLGLAIARGLVEAHGGGLSIEDAPSGGARISVRLPLFQSN